MSENRRLLCSALLSGLSAVLALFLWHAASESPVKSAPINPVGSKLGPAAIAGLTRLYAVRLPIFDLYQMELSLAVALSILSAMVALSLVRRRPVLVVLALASLSLLSFYLLFATTTIDYGFWVSLQFTPARAFLSWVGAGNNLGFMAVLALVDALAGFTMLFGRDWLRAFRMSLAVVGVPSVLYLMSGLLLTDPRIMYDHVISVATWTFDGAYILSNWNVLAVTLALGAVVYGSLAFEAVRKRHNHQPTFDSRMITCHQTLRRQNPLGF